MFWLKACGHCGGDLYQEADIYGKYVMCLQCGSYLSSAQQAVLRRISRQREVDKASILARTG